MSQNRPKLQNLNIELKNCQNCRLSETRMNTVCGEGNINSRLFVIAQAPGEIEDEAGKMFIGPSGKVLDELLYKSNIDRKEIYMTNLVKCMLPGYRKPKADEIEICSDYLDQEIEFINPGVIVPLGYYATRYVFNKYYSLSLRARMEFAQYYGKLFLSNDCTKKIFPLQHPAFLLYHDSMKDEMIKMYKKLKTLLVDCKWFPACPIKWYYEKGELDKKWIELYCKGDWQSCIRYYLEEKGEPHPDCMLPDGTVDEKLY